MLFVPEPISNFKGIQQREAKQPNTHRDRE